MFPRFAMGASLALVFLWPPAPAHAQRPVPDSVHADSARADSLRADSLRADSARATRLLHASATLRVRGTELDLGARNVLDRAYPELIAGGIVAPGQPRSLFGTVRHAF